MSHFKEGTLVFNLKENILHFLGWVFNEQGTDSLCLKKEVNETRQSKSEKMRKSLAGGGGCVGNLLQTSTIGSSVLGS